jgi:Glycosyltransferase family 87
VRAPLRPLAAPAAVAVALSVALGLLSLLTPAFTDYEVEAEGAFRALQHGDLARFLDLAPAYGGSLVLRAPFAIAPALWGGGSLALFRSVSVPGLLATAALGVAVFAAARRAGQTPRVAWLGLVLVAGSPMALRALEIGHPEELLGGALCAGALLAAGRDRATLAAVLLGLAVANKPWAVLAVVPVLAALPPGRRARALAVAGGLAALIVAPILLHGGQSVTSTAATAHSAGQIFQPWQVFWFFGDHGHVIMGSFGEKVGYRAAPAWAGRISHPLVVLAGVALAVAWWRRRAGAAAPHEPLLLLALVLLVRCLLDTLSIGYYHLPFLLALTAWEVQTRRGAPVLALTATALLWTTTDVLGRVTSPDGQAAAYLAWAVPFALLLGLRLLAPARFAALSAPVAAAARRALPTLTQATTRSSLGSELSTSQPS